LIELFRIVFLTLDRITFVCLPYSMGLDPNYAPDENTQDPGTVATAPQDQVPEPTRKRKTREKNDI
jgi:hypothetical protein